jgi:hypothetical protein
MVGSGNFIRAFSDMPPTMRRPMLKFLAPCLFGLFAGCQVVQQAADAVVSIGTSNSPEIIDIPPWRPFSTLASEPISRHDGQVLDVAEVSKTPSQLVSIGTDGTVIGWEIGTGNAYLLNRLGSQLQVAAIGHELPLVAYAADGKVFVTCAIQCQGTWVLDRLKPRVLDVAFHEHDSALLLAGADGRIYRWRFEVDRQASTPKERDKGLERYIAHQTLLSNVAGHPSGRAFFSTDWDGTLLGWLPYTADEHGGDYDRNLFGGRFFGAAGTFLPAGRAPDRGIASLAISRDGTRLAAGTEDGFVEVWEVRGFSVAARKSLHDGRVASIALSADGRRVASIGRDSQLDVSELVPDPAHRIAPTALPYRLDPVLTQTLGSGAANLLFTSSGNVIFSTKDGRIGEVDVAQGKVQSSPVPTPNPRSPGLVDTDY